MKSSVKYDSQAAFDFHVQRGRALAPQGSAGLVLNGIVIEKDVVIESECSVLSFNNVTVKNGARVIISDSVKAVNISCGNMHGIMFSDCIEKLSIKGGFPEFNLRLVTGGHCHSVRLENISILKGSIHGFMPKEAIELHLTKMGGFPLQTVLPDHIRRVVMRKTKLNSDVKLPILLSRLDVDYMDSIKNASVGRNVVVTSCDSKEIRSPLFGA